MTAVLFDERANFFDVIGALNERRRDKVHVVFDAEDDVFFILFRNGGQSECNARGGNALAGAHLAGVEDRRDDVFVFDLVDENLDKSVGEEKFIAGLDFGVEIFVADGNVSFIAGLIGLREDEFVAGGERDRAVFEFAEPHFRSLGVEDQRDDFFRLLCGFADAVDAHQMPFVIAMREIEARAVHAVLDELFDDTRSIGRRTLRADDLRLLQHDFASQLKKNFYRLSRLYNVSFRAAIKKIRRSGDLNVDQRPRRQHENMFFDDALMQDRLDRLRIQFELQLIFPTNDFRIRDAIGFVVEQAQTADVAKQHVDDALNKNPISDARQCLCGEQFINFRRRDEEAERQFAINFFRAEQSTSEVTLEKRLDVLSTNRLRLFRR